MPPRRVSAKQVQSKSSTQQTRKRQVKVDKPDDDNTHNASSDVNTQSAASSLPVSRKRVASSPEVEPAVTKDARVKVSKRQKAMQPKNKDDTIEDDVFLVQKKQKTVKSSSHRQLFVDQDSDHDEVVDATPSDAMSEDTPQPKPKKKHAKAKVKSQTKIIQSDESDIEVVSSPAAVKGKQRMSVPDKAKVARTQHSAKQTEPAIPVDEISSNSDAGDKRMVSVTQATPKKTKQIIKSEDIADQPEADNSESKPVPKGKEKLIYLEDIPEAQYFINPNAERGPSNCEVTQEDLFDPMLKDTYVNLPPLRAGILVTSNNGPNPTGPFALSSIPDVCPGVNMITIIKAITFSRAGPYVNPSRAAPSSVKPAVSSDAIRGTTYAIQATATNNFSYAVFTSVMAVCSSNLLEPEPQGIFRQITGTLCTQEWERFCAFFCTVFKVKELYAQIYEDAISISTRAKPKDTADRSQGFSRLLARGSPSKSPVKVAGSSAGGSVKGALNFDDSVPVYDGRNGNFHMNQLHRLGQTLQPWTADLVGCICLVGYTANTWVGKESSRQLSLNVQWVVVLASQNV